MNIAKEDIQKLIKDNQKIIADLTTLIDRLKMYTMLLEYYNEVKKVLNDNPISDKIISN